jgi:glutathione peroxidase
MAEKDTIYQFAPERIGGKKQDLSEYRGQVLLVVNTASECGFTPQFEGLEELYKDYKDQGFTILGFPSNEFQNQEPLEGEEIENFCTVNYGVSFPIFNKIQVKGTDTHPLFKFLSNKKQNGNVSSTPRWNFHKYLVDRNGKVVDFFYPFTKPKAKRVTKAIEELLEKK